MKTQIQRNQDFDLAFEEGRQARLAGKHLENCPYKSNSVKADGWKRGFIRQNLSLIKEHTTKVHYGSN